MAIKLSEHQNNDQKATGKTPNVQKTLILFDLLKVLLSLTYYTWVQILVVLVKTPTNTVSTTKAEE